MTPYSHLSDRKKAVVKLVRGSTEPISEAHIFSQLVDKLDVPAMEVKLSLEFLKIDGWIREVLRLDSQVSRRWLLTIAARNHSPS